MNNKGTSFIQYFVFFIVLALAAFLFLPNTVPFPLGGGMPADKDMKNLAAQMPAAFTSFTKPAAGQNSPSFAQMQNVKEMDIPQSVYDSLPQNPVYQQYLFGNKKNILMIKPTQTTYLQPLISQLNTAFALPDIQAAYTQNVVDFPQDASNISCNGDHFNCPRVWFTRYCLAKLCIINPSARRMAVANVSNADEVNTLLQTYKNW